MLFHSLIPLMRPTPGRYSIRLMVYTAFVTDRRISRHTTPPLGGLRHLSSDGLYSDPNRLVISCAGHARNTASIERFSLVVTVRP